MADKLRFKKKKVTHREFYAYRLAIENQFSTIHSSVKLFQQYVDGYCEAEANQLQLLQNKIRKLMEPWNTEDNWTRSRMLLLITNVMSVISSFCREPKSYAAELPRCYGHSSKNQISSPSRIIQKGQKRQKTLDNTNELKVDQILWHVHFIWN